MSVLRFVRIELWVEARQGAPAVNPVMRLLLDDLASAGAAVAARVPEHELIDPIDLAVRGGGADLVLLKTPTTLGLSLASADEASGVRFLNSARATLRAHDKAAVLACLAAAGVPVPASYLVAPTGEAIEPPPDLADNWVTKPVRGVHGQGVTMGRGPLTLAAPAEAESTNGLVVDDGARIVQTRIGGDEPDLKVYVAGARYFAGRKRFGPLSYRDDRIEPVSLDTPTGALVARVGAALGLRCFGVDLREGEDGPVVIDANPFPGYRGFPGAVAALRAEIERALELAV